VTIRKGGQVTFQVHGGGHAMALYEVSRDTTRDELGQALCAGFDPQTIDDPGLHPCNLQATNANARHIVTDGRDDVVLHEPGPLPERLDVRVRERRGRGLPSRPGLAGPG